MHLVDTTLFYSPTSGGVNRYRPAKHAGLAAHSSGEHPIGARGREARLQRGGLCTLSVSPVPATFNYRLPLNPRRWSRLLEALEPTLIEAGDAFHPAWCASQVARRRGIPVVGDLRGAPRDRKSTRLTPVTATSRMPASAWKKKTDIPIADDD